MSFMHFYRQKFKFYFALLLTVLSANICFSQSRDQAYPTAATTNEISGSIRARDVGDPRDTTYFYTFGGSQGDMFVNVVTKNLNGAIDIFVTDGLKPLTKILVFADTSDNETGRVIYLRKSEKLLLRVEGRTPNDDPATFTIKFAGSFIAAEEPKESDIPKLPEVTAKNETGIKVNSVGTIIEVAPKPTPKAEVAAKDEAKTDEAKPADDETAKKTEAAPEENKSAEETVENKKAPEVVVTDNLPAAKEVKTPPSKRPVRSRRRTARKTTPPPKPAANEEPVAAAEEKPKTDDDEAKTTAAAKKAPKPPDPLASVNLLVLFKDGRHIEKPMSEVLRFTVDRGVLTIISKDGKINRFSILDIEKVTIDNQVPQQ